MKGKILSVLFGLMLVFGMLFAACDNGAYPKDESEPGKKAILDFSVTTESGVNIALGIPVEDEDEGGDEDEE